MHNPRQEGIKQTKTVIRRRPLSLKYIRERDKKFWEELKEDDVKVQQLEENLGIGFSFAFDNKETNEEDL